MAMMMVEVNTVEETWHVFCESCVHGFVVPKKDMPWVKEPFNPKLGYRTLKATVYCPFCGEPISTWKRG